MTSIWVENESICISSPLIQIDSQITIPIKKELVIRDKNKVIITDEIGLIQLELLFGLNEIIIYHKLFGGTSPLNKDVESFFE